MSKNTPTTEHGQLYDSVISEVQPRAEVLVAQIISHLRGCGQEVETYQTYFLNSSSHPIEVPHKINGVPVSISFDGSMFTWDSDPQLRCKISVNSGRVYPFKESKNRFNLKRILRRLLNELQVAQKELEQRARADQAQASFDALRERLGGSGEGPEILKGEARVRLIPKNRAKVVVILTVSHEDAADLVERYGG